MGAVTSKCCPRRRNEESQRLPEFKELESAASFSDDEDADEEITTLAKEEDFQENADEYNEKISEEDFPPRGFAYIKEIIEEDAPMKGLLAKHSSRSSPDIEHDSSAFSSASVSTHSASFSDTPLQVTRSKSSWSSNFSRFTASPKASAPTSSFKTSPEFSYKEGSVEDNLFKRFLLSENGNAEKAHTRLSETMIWRRREDADMALSKVASF